MPHVRWSSLIKLAPFAVVALFAELSLALPPGPSSYTDTWLSVIFILGTAACLLLAPRWLPHWGDLVSPLLYLASTLALILAAGGSSTGVGLVVLLRSSGRPSTWTCGSQPSWSSRSWP